MVFKEHALNLTESGEVMGNLSTRRFLQFFLFNNASGRIVPCFSHALRPN